MNREVCEVLENIQGIMILDFKNPTGLLKTLHSRKPNTVLCYGLRQGATNNVEIPKHTLSSGQEAKTSDLLIQHNN